MCRVYLIRGGSVAQSQTRRVKEHTVTSGRPSSSRSGSLLPARKLLAHGMYLGTSQYYNYNNMSSKLSHESDTNINGKQSEVALQISALQSFAIRVLIAPEICVRPAKSLHHRVATKLRYDDDHLDGYYRPRYKLNKSLKQVKRSIAYRAECYSLQTMICVNMERLSVQLLRFSQRQKN